MDERSLPFDGSPHKISIGVRRLDLDDWVDLDVRSERVGAKLELLSSLHDEVMLALPGSEEGGAEVLDLMVDHLAGRGLVRREGDRLVDVERDAIVDAAGLHPLDAAARLVGEDLCLMEQRPDRGPGYTLTAGSVCFPSRWRLASKVGASLRAIHDPVPGYASIAEATDRYFEAITVERPVHRVNWTLIDDPTLFQPEPSRRDPAHASREVYDDPADQVFLRIERQTLRRLPRTGGVLFTIGTDVRPLSALSGPQRADLVGSLAGVDPLTVRYKGWAALLPAVVRWGDATADPPGESAPESEGIQA
jgi:dimethylamine monooxygenase subunit A